MARFKQRYLVRYWHGFGYYCMWDIARKPETTHYQGGGKATDTLPLALDAEQARQFFARQEPFGYLAHSDRDGRILAGWVDEHNYSSKELTSPMWDIILDARDYIREHRK